MIDYIINEPISSTLKVINAFNFGLNEHSKDNSQALINAFNFCQEQSDIKLIIPKGIYHFNNDKQIILNHANNIIIDGQESKFIFENPNYFKFNFCTNVKLMNLFIDWDWSKKRLADVGKIVFCEKDNSFFDIDFFELVAADEEAPWEQVNQFDELSLTPGVEGGKTYAFDSCRIKRIEKTDDQRILRVYPDSNSLNGIKKGEVYLIRHFGYAGSVFHIHSCTHFTIENVTIYSAYGAGYVISGDTQYYRLNGCKIGPETNTNHRISTTVDGFHVSMSKGYCIIENCDFSFTGDDAINIHDCVGIYETQLSENSILVECVPFFSRGDICEFKNRDLSTSNILMEVKSFKKLENKKGIITFKNPMPKDMGSEFILLNKRYDSSNYIIRNNYFHENRSRGLLLQCSNGLIENNRFYKTQAPPIYVMVEYIKGLWNEGSGATNINIVGNVFEKCNVSDWFSIIDIRCELFSTWNKAGIPANLRTEKYNPNAIFKDIKIMNNTFIDFLGYVFYIYTAENVIIENNNFSSNKNRTTENPKCGEIFVHSCKNVKIQNNTSKLSVHLKNPLFCNEYYSSSIVNSNNKIQNNEFNMLEIKDNNAF